jgi:hypothetical protein
MEIIGHVIVFLLASFQQYMWRSRGGKNSGFSALLIIVIAVGGVSFLGWWALLTMMIGMMIGATL